MLNVGKDRLEDRFVIYKNKEGRWRWNLVTAEFGCVAAGVTTYHSWRACIQGIGLLRANVLAAEYVESDPDDGPAEVVMRTDGAMAFVDG